MTEDQKKSELLKRIENDFVYHAPFGNQILRYARMRSRGKELAYDIVRNTPVSREQSLALTHLEEAIMWANAAVARNEKPDIPDTNTLYPDVLTTDCN
jgi:hypothetical protein